jgi:hypothetical protein
MGSLKEYKKLYFGTFEAGTKLANNDYLVTTRFKTVEALAVDLISKDKATPQTWVGYKNCTSIIVVLNRLVNKLKRTNKTDYTYSMQDWVVYPKTVTIDFIETCIKELSTV